MINPRKVFEEGREIKIILSLDGIIIYINENVTMATGFSKEQLVGQNISILRHASIPDLYYENVWKAIENVGISSENMVCQSICGNFIWTKGTIHALYDEDGVKVAYCSKKLICSTREAEEERQLIMQEHNIEIDKVVKIW